MTKRPATRPSRVESIERATGRTWSAWLEFMDRIGAHDLDHARIAAAVEQDLQGVVDNPAWWAQGVTVAYEQHAGRRVPGQRPDGTFEFNVSKATTLDMHALMDAWVAFAADDEQVRELAGGDPRRSGTDKRLYWRVKAQDGTSVQVSSEPKKGGSAAVVATHTGLASQERAADAKAAWRAILERFVGTITPA